MSIDLDDPEQRRRLVRSLLVVSPFGFVGTYLLAWVQGAASAHAALLGGMILAGCLAAAALFHFAGAAGGRYGALLILILRLFARR